MSNYISLFFQRASDFIDELPVRDKAKVLATIKSAEKDFDLAHTKILHSPARELIVKKYRLLFFIKGQTIFYVSGFVKKSQKTPKQEIDYVLDIYEKM